MADRESGRRDAVHRPLRVRLPGFIDAEVGLGDVVKKVTYSAGLRPAPLRTARCRTEPLGGVLRPNALKRGAGRGFIPAGAGSRPAEPGRHLARAPSLARRLAGRTTGTPAAKAGLRRVTGDRFGTPGGSRRDPRMTGRIDGISAARSLAEGFNAPVLGGRSVGRRLDNRGAVVDGGVLDVHVQAARGVHQVVVAAGRGGFQLPPLVGAVGVGPLVEWPAGPGGSAGVVEDLAAVQVGQAKGAVVAG